MARQLQHRNLQASGSNLDEVARQRCARRPRPEDKQVARGQGARNRGTGRDEHPERKGDWNSRSEARRAARAGFAIDSAKDKVQDENKIQSDQNQATRGRQNHIGTTTLREKKHMSRLGGIQRVVVSALSKGVPEAATSSQRQQRGSGNEHPGSTRPSTWPRDGAIREQRLDAALGVLVEDCTSTGTSKALNQQEQAPPDMMTGQSLHSCLPREVPVDNKAHSRTQRRQLRRVATTDFRREWATEVEAGHRARSRPHSGPQRERTRAGLPRRARATKLWKH